MLVTQMVADTGSRQRQKTAKNKEPLPMETEEVPPISHPSHSNLCGQVCVTYDVIVQIDVWRNLVHGFLGPYCIWLEA